ncbi:CHAT domain-containing protein [Erythrobacter sp. SCSIO 43205]|uniref:CHAT domain-containing protein n=1 Tax=Erythrobacter sp. SCSIO 43205 TaxID=2779361 RepID=UPI001CAA06CC|nr:CHAT domain-containing protein [Erythrobacter sp. SCSIO 43205]UAB77666.1 CHAT domain-containing protein [Erythrobacter sp. SCSIO 43205]
MGGYSTRVSAVLLGLAVSVTSASAQSGAVLTRDSFPIGDSDGILCQVQDRSLGNPASQSIFDRRWVIVCRDSPRPIAEVFAFKSFNSQAQDALRSMRRFAVTCPGDAASSAGPVAGSQKQSCQVDDTQLGWSQITAQSGGMTYYAEGYSAYDDATQLALQSVIDNAIAQGTIAVASTNVSDPLSFARVQAETLKPEQALAEGYRRNLAGEYAEAAAYFETLQQRLQDDGDAAINPGEFFVNRALQKSNLGEFAVASRLFERARQFGGDDPITARLLRNFEAIHLLNQGFGEAAIERVSQELPDSAVGAGTLAGELVITVPISERLNREQETGFLFGVVDELSLTPEERAQIIDAQALQIRGTARRLGGDLEGARADLIDAYSQALAVRDGRVTSITRLRTQVLGDLALIAERQGNSAFAEAYLRNGLALVRAQYPERRAVSASEAQLASFLLREEREAEALALYGSVIDRAIGKRNATVGFANQLEPYYSLLATRVGSDEGAANDFFKAAQVLVRPGVAETQAVLARRLSANSDEASRLFRQSVDLGREIERARIRFEALAAQPDTADNRRRAGELSAQIDNLENAQIQTQAQLNAYPQYRVVSQSALELDEFRAALKPGEAYTRLAVVGDDVYVFYTDSKTAKAYRAPITNAQLDASVDAIRDSIAIVDADEVLTLPFEIGQARELYKTLFGPIAAQLEAANHLIFEPDGAMLRLPPDLLVTDDASVERYEARLSGPMADEYDFTGVAWLGRGRAVSTAVSAEAFVQSRKASNSRAQRQYVGFGENAPVGANLPASFISSTERAELDCFWPANQWNEPISASELRTAAGIIGSDLAQVVTQEGFTDVGITQRGDLDEYRVLHFATHGLVTPPDPRCPAKPALVTSFGGAGSDGLLSFEEIFELDLDADLVILSACDTAGGASIEATRAAGLSTGGGSELEGLVRAFVGAGGRAVMASHWPVPDDFNATQRLMTEMFRRGEGQTIGNALGQSRQLLMDDAATSHPFYWAAFAVIGDATRPLLSSQMQSNNNDLAFAADTVEAK